ncbi:protease complex subunit PrcB family protein [Flavobacterium branchiophilum]|uniref:PrcB C-terminal domain-containing protein n=2 Tax=Flavobacterium branchiophilum TaxID=55197 RepID=G2Z775_FLABF|nr:protease complex subunit PrcB family protein [Flavobacterium branchiophilum]PDS24376.1 hypothetical protein B0A77_08195 [Flavobacterium branchiophilum]CCB69240.1 Protein of unknown function precursor [Flavobacterium branchiophilum FL-15]
MKKICYIVVLISVLACSSHKNTVANKVLYEVLYEADEGGNHFKFYEMVTNAKEFKMLLNDPNLKKKVHSTDIEKANYILINLGEKEHKGYKIKFESVQETEQNIVIKIQEIPSRSKVVEICKPFFIIKINSKKEIVITD